MAVVLSVLALLFSAFVFFYNRRSNKRELLLRFHEQLLAPERQHGRRVLFELVERNQGPDDLTAEEFRDANHSLSLLGMLGFLFCKRYIPRHDVLDLWALTAVRVFDAAEKSGFLALRDAQNGAPPWPYLHPFVTDARRHLRRMSAR
jgi:hypothetical protein